jgi:hypothetical protein
VLLRSVRTDSTRGGSERGSLALVIALVAGGKLGE